MPRLTKQKDKYKLTLSVFANKITSIGATPGEALEGLVYSGRFPSTGILSMSKGDKKVDKIITRVIGSRLFSVSPLMRQIALKTVSSLFEGL